MSDRGPLPVGLIADGWFTNVKRVWDGSSETQQLSTGYIALDKVTGGLTPATLTIVAARPSVGKTSLAVSLARNVSKYLVGVKTNEDTETNSCVFFFSLEMSNLHLMNNIVSQESGVPMEFFRQMGVQRQKGARAAFKDIDAALERIGSWPLLIDDEARTLSSITNRLRVMSALWTPRLIVVDYLQHMESENLGENRNNSMGVITRGLKAIAKAYDCPLILLSQLSRAALYGNEHQVPELQHLRDSGNIENDADNVWFLWRPEYGAANLTAPEERGVAYVLIAKQRQGPRLVKIPLLFHASTTRFIECPQALYNTLEANNRLDYFPEDVPMQGRRR